MGNPVVKNYIDPVTGTWVVNGDMEFGESATVTGLLPEALNAATASKLGGVKASAADGGDTVEVKINGTSKKLFVPTYPKADNQADSAAEDFEALLDDFNALLAKLKAAGLMTDDT